MKHRSIVFQIASLLLLEASFAHAEVSGQTAASDRAAISTDEVGTLHLPAANHLSSEALASQAESAERYQTADSMLLWEGSGGSGIKGLIESAAIRHDIPVWFFTRLIRQESAFNPQAVSPVGAMGIAQFMPATAAERGLADPFDPVQALPKSAELLKDLK